MNMQIPYLNKKKIQFSIWALADGQYQNQTDYIPCSQKQRNPIQSAKTRPEADCSSDNEFFFAKFRLKLKKVAHSDMT